MGRNEQCFCGSGKKGKKCHRTITKGSKLADIYLANQTYDIAIEEKGLKPNCPLSCSLCCNHFFFIDESEFLLILDNILDQGGSNLLQKYIDEAKEYQLYLENNFPSTMKLLDEYMPKQESLDVFNSSKYSNDNLYWDRSRPCILLKEGKCSVYDVRPNVCRTFGVSGHCEIIDNDLNKVSEQDDMVRSSRYISDGNSIVATRSYPIFYYFSFFLSGAYYDVTMSKLQRIRKSNEKDYAKFKLELNKQK